MRFLKKGLAGLLNIAIIAAALWFGYEKYEEYFSNPWTRDGQVRAQVIQVSPRVTGPVVSIAVIDNQFVRAGDLLFQIDPETYLIKIKQAEANLERQRTSSAGAKTEYDRVKEIFAKDSGAISQKELTRREVSYLESLSRIDVAEEDLNAARLNLQYTNVYAPVDGFISNINIQVGSQANANQPIVALVDSNSFWVAGYFQESQIGEFAIGDTARVTLMAYPDNPMTGTVESIGWGIATSDGNPGPNLLPSIKPVFQWIRLAQRMPVRVRLDEVPENVELRFGMSASVMITPE